MDEAKPKRGGARPGAGRKRNGTSRLSRKIIDRAYETGELPHEFLLRITRGEPIKQSVMDPTTRVVSVIEITPTFDERRDAAKAAAPYFAAKLSAIEVARVLTDDELDRIIADAAAEAGLSLTALGEGQ